MYVDNVADINWKEILLNYSKCLGVRLKSVMCNKKIGLAGVILGREHV